jgi:hypothetical protein
MTTVTDFLAAGEPTNDRARELLDQTATAEATARMIGGVSAFDGEIVVPALISPTAESFG